MGLKFESWVDNCGIGKVGIKKINGIYNYFTYTELSLLLELDYCYCFTYSRIKSIVEHYEL